MMKIQVLLACLGLGVTAPAVCVGDVLGRFVDLGVVNSAQVYGFEVLSSEPVAGMDFSAAWDNGFSGLFNNSGIDTDLDSIPDAPLSFSTTAPQPELLQETYFVISPVDLLSIHVADSVSGVSSFLGGAFARVGGLPLMEANTPTLVAIFSTADGVQPTLLGFEVALISGNHSFTHQEGRLAEEGEWLLGAQSVPEPNSAAILGLGLIGFSCRRWKD